MHCPPNDECSECFDRRHAAEHPAPVAGCFACKLDTIQLDARLHAARTTRYVPPRKPDNPWERGVSGQHRRDGSFMPYVDQDWQPIGLKTFADNRSRNEDVIRQYAAGNPTPV